jgi:hypothetical protein
MLGHQGARGSTLEARASRGMTAAGSARHAARRVVARYPALYVPIARRRHRENVLGPDTQLIIDGFPRSASTFTLVGFQVAQNGHVRVAHHVHAVAHLIAGARRSIPMLVPIREPKATVVSAMIREPNVSIGQWLRSYIDHYQRIPSLADSLMLAPFEEIIDDLGRVIRRLNQRFGTSYVEFRSSEEGIATVFDLIEERSRRPPWEHLIGEFLGGRLSYDEYRDRTADRRTEPHLSEIPETLVPRPSPHREAIKAALVQCYSAPRIARLRARAERAYEVASSLAG